MLTPIFKKVIMKGSALEAKIYIQRNSMISIHAPYFLSFCYPPHGLLVGAAGTVGARAVLRTMRARGAMGLIHMKVSRLMLFFFTKMIKKNPIFLWVCRINVKSLLAINITHKS